MSSTNRGGQRRRADYYTTPAWCVRRLLEKLQLPGGNWLEPGAGEGNIIRTIDRPDVKWTALELREECRPYLERLQPQPEIVITDRFISDRPEEQKPLAGRHFSVAFGNPPFSLAMQFVKECLKYADTVVLLLRLNFLASKGRASFMKKHAPDVYVLPNRPSFTGQGTDSIEYAWFVWNKSNLLRAVGTHTTLDLTPARERNADANLTRKRQETLTALAAQVSKAA